MTVKKIKAGHAPALDAQTSPDALMMLAERDTATDRLLACHAKATGELLSRLAHSSDKATRQAVARHPNTPLEVLFRLGQQFPKEFLTNPALDLLLMVSPHLMEEASPSLLVRLLKRAECPGSMLLWAAGHHEAKVQLAVAMNPTAPDAAIERLRESPHASVRDSIQARQIESLQQDPDTEFEQAVRDRLGSMSFDTLQEAWRAADIGVAQWRALPRAFWLGKAAGSDVLSPEAIAVVLSKTSWTLGALRTAMPGYPCWDEVAIEPNTPLNVVEEISKECDLDLQKLVARNTSTTAANLDQLAHSSDQDVRLAVAYNPSVPRSVLERLAGDPFWRVRKAVAEHSLATALILERLGSDTESDIRKPVAGHPNTPPAVLEILCKESDRGVRERVAGNPSTPAAVLGVLTQDPEIVVRWMALSNPSTPQKILANSACDSDLYVRQKVAANHSAGAEIFEALAKDAEVAVRGALASNPKAPGDVLEGLLADQSSEVVLSALRNPCTPTATLIRLSESKSVGARSVGVRNALAKFQAHRSEAIFRALFTDKNTEAHEHLAGNAELDTRWLDEMAASALTERTLVALLGNPRLSPKGAQSIADRLFTCAATDSVWYQHALEKASLELQQAARSGKILSFFGKDPNKTVLAKRDLAPLMALCAGPYVEPARIVKVSGSTDWLVRAAVARNPGTPPNLLKKLRDDSHPLVAAIATKNGQTESDASNEVTSSPANAPDMDRAATEVIRRILAMDKKEKQPRRWEIPVKYLAVKDDVWTDRFLTAETLSVLHWRLNARVSLAAWRHRPIVSVAEVLAAMDEGQRSLLCEFAASSSDPQVRLVIAEFEQCPAATLRMLANDKELEVRCAALSNRSFPEAEREFFVKKLLRKKIGVLSLKKLLRNQVPAALLESIAASEDHFARRVAATNPHITPNLLETLAIDPEQGVRHAVAQHDRTPSPCLVELAKDVVNEVRGQVGLNSFAPTTVLVELAQDEDKWVRRSVAENPSTPPGVLLLLAKDAQSTVREAVAGNVSTPGPSLELLAADSDEDVKAAVAKNPATPNGVLVGLANDEATSVRMSAIETSLDLPEVMLKRLAVDSNRQIRKAVASKPSMPMAILTKMARDDDEDIRRAVSMNVAASHELLEILSRDENELVRCAVAQNPSTPSTLLMTLGLQGSEEVRHAAARNPNAPPGLLDRYINLWANRLNRSVQREVYVRQGRLPEPQRQVASDDLLRALQWLALLWADDDNKALTKASRSKDWLVRLGVALHPGASDGILKLLSNDSDSDVARAAAARKGGP